MSNEINVLTPYELFVCCYYDELTKKSILVTMHETVADAIRRFEKTCCQPEIKDVKNDLILYRIGIFNTRTLEVTSLEKTVLKKGNEVLKEGVDIVNE